MQADITVAGKKKKTFFKLGRSRSKAGKKPIAPVLIGLLRFCGIVCVLVAIAAGFIYLGRCSDTGAQKRGFLELVDTPVWVNEQLKDKIYNAATAGGEDLTLDDDAARTVQQNLESRLVWLEQVMVRTTSNSIRIKAKWRRPVAIIKMGGRKLFYVDGQMVVLDFVPVEGLPIVWISGLSRIKPKPVPGQTLFRDDIAAAIAVIEKLDRMDAMLSPDKPLLYEIERIDMSNFNGRKSKNDSHIVLYTRDDTPIFWGCEVETWQRYMEATDEEKLAKLYEYYKSCGTLMGSVKHINLRYPQDRVPQPVDKY